MKKAILAASFGTSYKSAAEKSLNAVEKSFKEAFPEYDIYRSFTSGMIIRILGERGIGVDSIDEAIKKLYNNKYECVIVQPTHLIGGEEYEKLYAQAIKYRDCFKRFEIGAPLLNDTEDLKRVCGFFHEKYCIGGRFLVLMGHGTEHKANAVYSEMNDICRKNGYDDMFIGTVEAEPSVEDVIEQLGRRSFSGIVLTPLMLVAGDHAHNDMAGNSENSWKSRLETFGEVETILTGMGEYEEIRNMYVERLRKIIEKA